MKGMEVSAIETEPSARGTLLGIFSCKAHVDLSSRLIEGFTFSVTEELVDVNL